MTGTIDTMGINSANTRKWSVFVAKTSQSLQYFSHQQIIEAENEYSTPEDVANAYLKEKMHEFNHSSSEKILVMSPNGMYLYPFQVKLLPQIEHIQELFPQS